MVQLAFMLMCFDAPFSSKNQGNPESKQEIYILTTRTLTQHGKAEYFRAEAPTPLNTSALHPSLTPPHNCSSAHTMLLPCSPAKLTAGQTEVASKLSKFLQQPPRLADGRPSVAQR